jgi:hypothetical protein
MGFLQCETRKQKSDVPRQLISLQFIALAHAGGATKLLFNREALGKSKKSS